MKYVLGVGFGYQHYRDPANIKIYSGDRLVDDFNLDNDIEVIQQKPSEFLQKNFKAHEDDNLSLPAKCRLYELEEKQLSDYFKFEIHCNSNNYSNGFMTKTSLVCPNFIFLLPADFLQHNLQWYQKIWGIGQKNLKKTIQKVKCKTCGGRGFTRRTGDKASDTCKDCLQRNKVPPPEIDWPCVWQYEKINTPTKLYVARWSWLGGNIVLRTPVIKKHGIHMFSNYPKQTIGANIWLPNDFLQYLDKINKFNEDTRSN
tara:strand:+ start:240 stop:1010 length:771 start_codon:yes stop_codon:yes gene_type:complete